ncbi:hypothetical protein M441DRAFT_451686 [Trichoderma asperellum CBS 433.97]|uniref:Uncharacterized protein n=1 Tax=Trichoderma asperellum (strain ATCC 204424 / CBS 433.97 / NBRC 101777) TaxID=1042311 RepID=A0A2T3ZL30_TRIA4|nr:hypothetical protein M441DRAFT_451686 [Trichoderma asperellum CBS 433.97]PTB45492.1 hypothetical protein M441DRAFT_451686 [Trichoderma asperellum CBS 433.97]
MGNANNARHSLAFRAVLWLAIDSTGAVRFRSWRTCSGLVLAVSRCEAAESPLRPLTSYRDLSDLLPVAYLGLAALSESKGS